MKVKADENEIELTHEFINAVQQLMIATMKNMSIHEPQYAKYWQVGGCKITDLMISNGMNFSYAGKDEAEYIKSKSDIYVELPLTTK